MKLYIMSVICISAIGMLVNMLSPDGEGGGISKNIKLVYGICVALVCIYPIKNAVNAIYDLEIHSIVGEYESNDEKYENIFDSAYSDAEIDNLKNGIKQILYDRYEIDFSECKIDVVITEDTSEKKRLRRVLITLYGSAIWKNTDEIESTLADLLSCEIVTAIG